LDRSLKLGDEQQVLILPILILRRFFWGFAIVWIDKIARLIYKKVFVLIGTVKWCCGIRRDGKLLVSTSGMTDPRTEFFTFFADSTQSIAFVTPFHE